MQKLIYSCDSPICGKEIGAKAHISLVLNPNSQACGVALPPKSKGNTQTHGWMVKRLSTHFLHFCGPECIGTYFREKLSLAIGEPFKRSKKKA